MCVLVELIKIMWRIIGRLIKYGTKKIKVKGNGHTERNLRSDLSPISVERSHRNTEFTRQI